MKNFLARAGGFIGIAGIVVIGFLYFAAGLLAPLWAVIVLNVVWLAHLVLGCVWFVKHPTRVVLLPISLAVIWFGSITAGGALLDWTA